jgi:hypothetical protein
MSSSSGDINDNPSHLVESAFSGFLQGKYEGEMIDGRFHGHGSYTLSENCKYVGNFLDGMFHGEGTLYVQGGCYQGYWKEGKLVDGGFIFEDGLSHLKIGYKYWDYCSQYDRRFYSEIKEGVRIGDELKYASSHNHRLPKDCYDVIDGYYDAKRHTVYSYTTGEEIRTPNSEEIDFILNNCRIGK